MDISVRELLEMEALKDSQLIAGKNGINREIKHINAMEVPDISPWLSEGELLITTGYSIKDDYQAFKNLILGLYQAKSAALAIKTRFIGSVEDSLIDLADELNVPIILIPNEISFVSITTPIIHLLVEKQKDLQAYYQEIHNLFIDLELNGQGFIGISNMISKLLKLPSLISDANFNILASSHTDKNLCKSISNLDINYPNLAKKIYDESRSIEEISLDGSKLLVRKVLLRDKICAFILIDITNYEDEIPEIVLDHASTVVALEQSKKEAILEYNSNLDNMFFVDIMSNNIKSDQELFLRAEALNWPILPYIPIYFDISNFSSYSENFTELELYNIKMNIVDLIKAKLSKLSQHPKVFLKSDNFSCLLPCKEDFKNINEEIDHLMEDIIREVADRHGIKLYGGIGGLIEDLSQLKLEMDNAKIATSIAQLIEPDRHFTHIKNVHFEHGVLTSSSKEYFKKFVLDQLSDIKTYDEKHNSDLLHSLREYIRCGKNATAAANKLYIHRNTLNYRLNQIEKFTSYNLDDTSVIVDLAMAFRINNILHVL